MTTQAAGHAGQDQRPNEAGAVAHPHRQVGIRSADVARAARRAARGGDFYLATSGDFNLAIDYRESN